MLNRILASAIILAVATMTQAEEKKEDKKEVTVKGTIVCTKCALKETEQCGNAIQVKEGDKTVTYYIDDKAKGEDYHKKICTGAKNGSVTGVVSEKDGKHYITPNKDGVKFD